MKTKDKIQDLIVEGFSIETLISFTDSQIDAIHKRVVKEQGAGSVGGNKGEVRISPYVPNAVDMAKKIASSGIPAKITSNEEITEKKKKSKKNPWAICTSSLSDEFGTSERSEWTKSQKKKYERCVMGVKKSMEEGRNPYEPIIESKIIEIVKNNIQPRMTKKDFITTLIEQSPKEKEKTKAPTKTPQRQNPFRNPNPGTKEKPRGKAEKMKSDFINLLKKTIE